MAAGALITQTGTRELAYRSNGGLHVTLLWQEHDDTLNGDQLFVLVLDERAGTVTRIAAERENALDVFNHPFAYA